MNSKTYASSFRLTEQARRLLERLATKMGISRGDVLELLIREKAKEQGVEDEQPVG